MEPFSNIEAVVLAAGDFPSHPLAARWLDHPHVVCLDGAAASFLRSGRRPWRAIGDGDSLAEDLKNEVNFTTEAEQETNDLSKAMRMLHAEGLRRVVILGATGKREDHTLGNIALLADYHEQGFHVAMVTDHGTFLPCHGSRTFACGHFLLPHSSLAGRQLSIFNLSCRHLTATGLAYPTYPFARLWQGTLNAIVAPTFHLAADGAYLLYLAHEEQS